MKLSIAILLLVSLAAAWNPFSGFTLDDIVELHNENREDQNWARFGRSKDRSRFSGFFSQNQGNNANEATQQCSTPPFHSQFRWSSIKEGLYYGTLCTTLVKWNVPSSPAPPFGVSCQNLTFGIRPSTGDWVMKYPADISPGVPPAQGQRQYVNLTDSRVLNLPSSCLVVDTNGQRWPFSAEDDGWASLRYDPLGKEVTSTKYTTHSGLASDVGSCGLYVEGRAVLECVERNGIQEFLFVGANFQQPVVEGPFNVDVHGTIDVTDPVTHKVVYKPLSHEPNFFDQPSECLSTTASYCAATSPLTPDFRTTLAFAVPS